MTTPPFQNADGLSLHARHWECSHPVALIVLVHGQGEHIGRYNHVADFFNRRQVAVWGYDQQGFGKSGGKRGHAAGLQAYLNDLRLAIQKAQQHYPDLPLFLYGHSMGGNVVLNYLLRTPDARVRAAIATGPWIQLAFEPPALKVWAGRALKSLLPSLSLPSGLNTQLLSRDPAVVSAYDNDPLVHDRVSAAAGISMMEGALWLHRFQGQAPLPLLLMHGGADGITSAAATRALAERLSGDVLYKEWEGMYHEIHNEPGQLEVLEYEWTWLQAFLPTASPQNAG